MISLNKIVAILSERASREFDVAFKLELKDIVDSWRLKLMRQTLMQNPQDRKFFLQSFNMPLEKVDKVACPFNVDCDVLRTTSTVPLPIRANSILFDFVGSPDKVTSYSYAQDFFLKFFAHSPITKNAIRYVYRDNYLYILNSKSLKHIGIEGIFSYPSQLKELQCITGCDTSDDAPYPMPTDQIEDLITGILSVELSIKEYNEDTEVPVDEKTEIDKANEAARTARTR